MIFPLNILSVGFANFFHNAIDTSSKQKKTQNEDISFNFLGICLFFFTVAIVAVHQLKSTPTTTAAEKRNRTKEWAKFH